jgi:hypothetical protein
MMKKIKDPLRKKIIRGSPKQITWAYRIRLEIMQEAATLPSAFLRAADSLCVESDQGRHRVARPLPLSASRNAVDRTNPADEVAACCKVADRNHAQSSAGRGAFLYAGECAVLAAHDVRLKCLDRRGYARDLKM